MHKEKKINASINMAVLQNVNVLQLPLGNICGIYNEICSGCYQIFLNNLEEDHEMCDRALVILMKHHNSSQKGMTKVLTINDLLPMRY